MLSTVEKYLKEQLHYHAEQVEKLTKMLHNNEKLETVSTASARSGNAKRPVPNTVVKTLIDRRRKRT